MDAIEVLRSLYEYNWWVNQRLLDLAEQVPEERTRESFGGGFDTILGTEGHILGAETHYYARCSGETQAQRPELTSVRDARRIWDEQHLKMERLLDQLGTDGPSRMTRYTSPRTGETMEAPIWQILLQMVNHGTHHRAELADMLTRVGLQPPPTDYFVYCQQQSG